MEEVKVMNIWAASLCNLLVPLKPAYASSQICYFYLIMECCCPQSTLHVYGLSHTTQCMIGSLYHMVNFGFMVEC